MSTDNNTNFYLVFFIVHIDTVFDLAVHFETESFGRFDANLPQRTS